MKKSTKILAAGLLSAFVLAGAGYALTAEDSLVTLSYLTDKFVPAAEQKAGETGNQKLQETYNAGKTELDKAQKELQGQLPGHEHSGLYSSVLAPLDCYDAETFELGTGGSVRLNRGTAVVYHDGALIDATTGTEVERSEKSGVRLDPGHLYLVGEDSTARVEIKSGIAQVGVQSEYQRTGGNPEHLPFYDISHLDWYYRYIEHVCEKNYFAGVSETEFGPGVRMNRAMVVTVLYKMAGEPKDELEAAAHHSFKDVPEDSWFAPYVKWAYDQKLTGGTGPNTFHPAMLVTREQFAQFLYSFSVRYLGREQPQRADLSVFEDQENISSWATEAVSWSVAVDILGSMEHGRMVLLPGWSSDRAAMAGMLYEFDHLEA